MNFDLHHPAIDFIPRIKKPMRLGIIPLVDVAFFLLIYFMVAGTIDQFEVIDITPPVAESGALLDEGHMVILLGKRDEIVMDDRLLTPEELGVVLKETLRMHPDKVITLKADAGMKAVQMIAVMDVIKAAGGKQLTIATEEASTTSSRSTNK